MDKLTSWFKGSDKDKNEGNNGDSQAQPDPSISVVEGAESSTLPKYNTWNDLPPQFQLGPEHDEDFIFPGEYELIEEVRKQCPEVAEWPDRYVLIFLFARRHSIPHTLQLLQKHLKWLNEMGCTPVTKTNPYPCTPDQLDEKEMRYALFGGFTLYKHKMVDKHNRLLRYQVMRHFLPGEHSLKDYMMTTIWWYYSTFQFVPLSVHRNGHAVVVDMKGMGWSNLSFSREIQQTLMHSTSSLPGRMRVCWIVNSNWMLASAMSVAKFILSAKIMARMHTYNTDELANEIVPENIPESLGGTWVPDLENEWYGVSLELDRKAHPHLPHLQQPKKNLRKSEGKKSAEEDPPKELSRSKTPRQKHHDKDVSDDEDKHKKKKDKEKNKDKDDSPKDSHKEKKEKKDKKKDKEGEGGDEEKKEKKKKDKEREGEGGDEEKKKEKKKDKEREGDGGDDEKKKEKKKEREGEGGDDEKKKDKKEKKDKEREGEGGGDDEKHNNKEKKDKKKEYNKDKEKDDSPKDSHREKSPKESHKES